MTSTPTDLAMSAKPIPIRGPAMAFLSGLTVSEFIDANALYGHLLTSRINEVRLSAAAQFEFSQYSDILYLLMLLTPEDPDTVAVLPVLDAIAKASPRLSLRLIRDEDDLGLLSELIGADELAVVQDELDLPQTFLFDEEWQLVGQWGPRPRAAERYLDGWLERHPEYETLADSNDESDQDEYSTLLDQLTFEMRVWYNSGLDSACVEEFRALLASIGADDDKSNGDDTDGADDDEAAGA